MVRSENRKRTHLVAVRLLPDEHSRLTEAAVERSQSVSEVLRTGGLPPSEQPDCTCKTVGELINNFLYMFDRGERDSLRRQMIECAEWLRDMPLPPDEEEA